jgi:xanthine/uracil permease
MARQVGHEILYEPDESPPFFSGLFLGFQTIIGMLVTIVVYGTVMVRAAGQSDEYLSWAILMGIVVSGFVMVLQAFRLWRIGAGYTLSNGPSSVFMVVCITALIEGGPALMSLLVIVATIFQVALTTRLSLLRRVITPMISGTVLILLSATAITVLLGAISADEGITDASMRGVVVSVLATVAVALGIRLFGAPFWQQWAPVITIGAGCVVSAIFGLYDFRSILEAPLVGAPVWSWPGLDVNVGVEFWALLPGFVVVFLASSIGRGCRSRGRRGAGLARPTFG